MSDAFYSTPTAYRTGVSVTSIEWRWLRTANLCNDLRKHLVPDDDKRQEIGTIEIEFIGRDGIRIQTYKRSKQ